MQRFALFSLAVLAWISASCNKIQEQKEDPLLPGQALSENDLQGIWTIVEETCTETLTFDKGFYLRTKAQIGKEATEREYGTYTLEDDVITWQFSKFEYRSINSAGEYSDWSPEIPDPSAIKTRTAHVRGMYNKAALVLIEFVSPYSNYQEFAQRRIDDFVIIYYRNGAHIPSDARTIQGRWEWMAHNKDKEDTLWESIELKDDTFDYIKHNYGNRFTGSYTFENGYLMLRITGWYAGGWSDELNDYVWRPTTRDWTPLFQGDCFQKPFLPVNDTTCYSRIQNFNSIFIRR